MGTGPSRGTARKLGLPTLLVLLLVALVAAGCGGDDDDANGDAANGAAANGDAAEVAASAEEAIAPFLEPPESIGTDVPLSEQPPSDLHVISLSCELDVCANWRDQVEIAAGELGWTADGISFDGTPEDTLAKVNQAVAAGPDGIILNGVPRETYELAVQRAEQENVPIVTQMGELEGEVTDPFVAVQYQQDAFDVMAEATGRWMIADSGATGHALTLSYAQFPLSEGIAATTKETIDNECPDCQTTALRVQAADTGTKLPSSVVSEIQRDPSVNYVILQDMAMAAGLEAALREANLLEEVTVIGNNVTPEAIQSVLDGNFLGIMAFSLRAAAFQGVDAVARHVVGDEQQDVPLMNQILTQETLPADPEPDVWQNLPPDLSEQYTNLWLVD